MSEGMAPTTTSVGNIAAHAADGVSPEVQGRVIGYWTEVDHELGMRLSAAIQREEQ